MRPIEFNTLNGHSQGVIDRLNKALVGFTAEDVLLAMNKGMDDEELASLAEVLEGIKNEAVINGEGSVKKHFDNVVAIHAEDLEVGKIYRDIAGTYIKPSLLKLVVITHNSRIFKLIGGDDAYISDSNGLVSFSGSDNSDWYYCESDQNITE